MQTKHKDTLIYVIIIFLALGASFLLSPVWGGTVLFWVGIAVTVFFVFAILGTLYSGKFDD